MAFILLGTLTISSCQKESHDDDNENCTNNTGWLRDGYEDVYVNTPTFIPADSMYVNTEEVSAGVFKSTTKFDDGTMYPTHSVYLQACGNSIYQSNTPDLANKQEIYRMDGNVGDTWSFTVTSAGGETLTTTTTVIERNVSVTVPAGIFSNCIKFRNVVVASSGGSATTDFYVNNDAGPVLADGTTLHYELARKNY